MKSYFQSRTNLTSIIALAAMILSTLLPAFAGGGSFYPVGGKNLTYTVGHGENLLSIAEKYHMAAEHLMWANGRKVIDVPEGTSIVIPAKRIVPKQKDQPESSIVVNVPEYMVYLFGDKGVINYYPIAAGAPATPTPITKTKVIEKVKNPTWVPPEWAGGGDPVPPGTSNPLGDRWVGLSIPGYGIHSTTSPSSIGLSASHGCMRMRPANARAFFDLVKVGMPVSIIYEPVLIGQDSKTKIVYMSVFPDTYSRIGNYYNHTMEKLSLYGIENIVDTDAVKSAINAKSGTPVPILGTDIEITVNGEPAELELPPVSRSGKLYVTDTFFDRLGVTNEFDGETMTFRKGELSCSYRVFPDFSWNGEYLIPLRDVLEKLGITTEFGEREVRITCLDEY